MRILAIGDPHGDLRSAKSIPLKGVDLILLTGDLGSANLARKMAFGNIEREKLGLPEIEYSSAQRKKAYMEIYDSAINLVRYLAKYAPVYTIFGNVEMSNSEVKKQSREIGLKLPLLKDGLEKIPGVRIINNRIANFEGVRIGGLEYFIDTSWVKEFKPGDYSDKMREAKRESDKARKVLGNFGDVEILLCHQPPYGILDKVAFKGAPKHWIGKHAGSKVVLDYVQRKQPRYVFCGHIHEQKGARKIGKSEVCNLGVCGWKIVDIQ